MTSTSNDNPESSDGNVKLGEWSDIRCLKISRLNTFPAVVKDIQVQKNIISHFLNFYLGGKIQKGLSARDLVFSVIAIMPVSLRSENFIWDEKQYSDKGTLFFLTPDDRLRDDIECVLNKTVVDEKIILENDEEISEGEEQNSNGKDIDKEKIINNANKSFDSEKQNIGNVCVSSQTDTTVNTENIDVHTENGASTIAKMENENDHTQNDTSTVKSSIDGRLRWYRTKYDNISEIKLVTKTEYSPVENAAFCMLCNKLLNEWESNLSARTALKYFFAMAALVVLRSTVKSYQNLSKFFATKFFNNLLPSEMISFTTPHKGFLKKTWKVFREPDLKTQIMFSKLVINSFLQRDRLNGFGKTNILAFAVLSHTADFGMGIISMLQLLATRTYSFKSLFESLYSKETAVSWHHVDVFLKKYLCETARQHTFHWARVIENEQFKHLSCTENYALAVVIAVFIEKIFKESGVWNSSWVNRGENLDSYKQLGYKLYEDYKKKESAENVLQQMFFAII